MKLSLYVHLFEKGTDYYLYNSQTGLLTTIARPIYKALYNRDFGSLPEEAIKALKEKTIIVDDHFLYDYYEKKRLSHFSSIGAQDSLNLVIAPTTGCNFACPYCFEGEKKDQRMTPEIINELISFINGYHQAKKLLITWYGGEPLTAFNVMQEIVSKIKNCCKIELASQSMITNGYLINAEVIDFIRSNRFESIQISLDGVKEHHNQTRCLKGNKRPTYDQILANVDKLAMEISGQTRINIRVNINKENEDDFHIMYKYLHERYAGKDVSVYPGFIREEGKGNGCMCYDSLFGKARFEFYKKIEEQGLNVDFFPQKEKKGCMTCHNNSLIIGPEGEIYKCWNDFNNPEKIVGYIKDRKITNPSLISQYNYDATIYNDSKCKDCKVFPICDGGCGWMRHQNMFQGKSYDLCTYLSDDSRLEECLLKKPSSKKEWPIRAI